MKNLSLYFSLLFSILFLNSAFGQDRRIIRDVILLNVQPYEVLMTEHGDVVAKIKHLPDYLKSDVVIPKVETRSGEDAKEWIKKQEVIAQEEPKVIKAEPVIAKGEAKASVNSFIDYYEINFVKGTATLSPTALRILNELADTLKAYPDKSVQIFGFQNESPIVASLLSQRRQAACKAYLKIKGVPIHTQVFNGSTTRGSNNKVVFGFK